MHLLDGKMLFNLFQCVLLYLAPTEFILCGLVLFTMKSFMLSLDLFLGLMFCCCCLTLICLVDFSIFITWTSPFPVLGVSGVWFHFYSILIEISVIKQRRL